MKTAYVFGAGGFIGNHMVSYLKKQGYYVEGYDLKYPEFNESEADMFHIMDLSQYDLYMGSVDEIYQFAADMGGAGYIFSGQNDANVMTNSVSVNTNILNLLAAQEFKGKIFYSSSACMYPAYNQEDPNNPNCKESSAYPAAPDSEYGWEKLFSERLYMAYARNYGIDVRIGRFHNIFGPLSCYNNGKEKYPAAITRKVIEARDGDEIEIWGDGKQTRSFLYIDECIEGVVRLMNSDFKEPVNIGSDEIISVNDLAEMVIKISGKNLSIKNIASSALGVRGRNSDNDLIFEKLNWKPTQKLEIGMKRLYKWLFFHMNKTELAGGF